MYFNFEEDKDLKGVTIDGPAIDLFVYLGGLDPFVRKGKVFDIGKYGGKSNSDLAQALTSAYKEACASTTPSKWWFQKGHTILSPVNFEGPCRAPIEFQFQGTFIACCNRKKLLKIVGLLSAISTTSQCPAVEFLTAKDPQLGVFVAKINIARIFQW
ncbi:hypothetical protein LWI28_006534 [Acer negundo]|uniref:Uncharacterized protein n=1 Tax=Acer negundo TaxID=4023 RepID=A0AAD5IST6_ACENE|nr:hypothetical protein LWI28_006534 [Acer negundo]